jgi:protein Mpv17
MIHEKPKNPLKRFLDFYLNSLETNPIKTKVIAASVLVATSDIIAQLLFESTFDFQRVGRMFILGGILTPWLHVWYGFLAVKLPATSFQLVLIRTCLDQFINSPIFIAVIFCTICILENRVNDIPDKLRNEWTGTVYTSWKLWIPVMFINFKLVPVQHQILVSNLVGVVWNTYLSWRGHAGDPEVASVK